MTTQTAYAHVFGPINGTRFKGTITDGTETSVSTDTTPALSLGDWAGESGVVITHALVTADTNAIYAYVRSRNGITKGFIPIATTGAVQQVPKLMFPIRIEIGDLLRVMTGA
jgi:hypothetical protein